jgi:hypothetical protein
MAGVLRRSLGRATMKGPRCRVAKNRAGWHRSLPKDLRGSGGLEESSQPRGPCSETGDGAGDAPGVLRLWLSLLRLWSSSGNLLRCLAWCGRLRVGPTPVGWIGNESSNGEKCSGGHRTDLFIGVKARAGAQQQPDPNLQLNSGFGERIGK